MNKNAKVKEFFEFYISEEIIMDLFTISHIKTSFKLDTCSFESAAII